MRQKVEDTLYQTAKTLYFEHLCSKLTEHGFKRQSKIRAVRRMKQCKQGITVFQEKYRGYDYGYIRFTAFYDFPKVNVISAYIRNEEYRKGFTTGVLRVAYGAPDERINARNGITSAFSCEDAIKFAEEDYLTIKNYMLPFLDLFDSPEHYLENMDKVRPSSLTNPYWTKLAALIYCNRAKEALEIFDTVPCVDLEKMTEEERAICRSRILAFAEGKNPIG